MNLREANFEAQRRWGPCGCAWLEESWAPNGYTVGILVLLQGKPAQRVLGSGSSWTDAFFDVMRKAATASIVYPACGIGPEGPPSRTIKEAEVDDQIRDMTAPSPDVDPKYRMAVERIEAAMADAFRVLRRYRDTLEHGRPISTELVTELAGFILTERARL